MNVIFLGLVVWNVLFFGATVATGMAGGHWRVWHFSLGVFTGILACLTHSLVFIQLIGSGKGIKEAVESHGLPDDPERGYVKRTKQFKARAFPCALSTPLITLATAWLGAWHDTNAFAAPQWRETSHGLHMWIAWLTIAANVYAFWKEYGVIAENTAMIHEINQVLEARNQQTATDRLNPKT